MTVQAGPYNLIAGIPITINLPAPGAAVLYPYLVIYNNSSLTLTVTNGGDTDWLLPLSAEAYKLQLTGQTITVQPQVGRPIGTYVGTITTTFYESNDAPPRGYPLTLSAYPGGEMLIAQAAFANGNQFLVTPGATQLIVQVLTTNPPHGPQGLFVQGIQSGTIYSNFVPYDVGDIALIDISAGTDQTFNITYNGKVSVYSSTLGVPTSCCGGTIQEITSTGGTVTITDPFGPVVNLEVVPGAGNPVPVNVVAVSGSAQTLPDVETDTGNDITLSANCTITTPTAVVGGYFYCIIRQAPAASFTATFTGAKWPAGIVPVVSAAHNAVDLYEGISDGTSWFLTVAGQGFA